jgi:hypothetical protein
MKRTNRVGEVHGLLTVIEFAGMDKKQSTWLCKCECGNTIIVKNDSLKSEHRKSCGCLKKKVATQNNKIALENRKNYDLIEGTCIRSIDHPKLLKNNVSGVTGVYYDTHNKRWRARIEFKGKKYYLGSHKLKEDAIKARLEAEKEVYGKFLEWYKKEYKNKVKK